ncbi:MAG: alpha/beta hydrolase [Halieaceae bacterium]|jgi:pimeloyl-ACP methyl ester carboxylesterase|nr:alpha/beta hydrolase [Halieaceae bacterium]
MSNSEAGPAGSLPAWVSIDDWEKRGRYAELLDQRIFYVDEAATEEERGTILLVHGFPTSSWDWWKIWPELNRHYRLVAPDLLGFGFSAKPSPHDYRIMEQADLCEVLAEYLGLNEFHVLAHDYGDTVAQEMLARQNEGLGVGRWRSCLFLNGGLFPETHRARPVQKLLRSRLGFLIGPLMTRRSLRRSFDTIFGESKASDAEIDAFFTLFERDGGRRNLHRLIPYMSDRIACRDRWLTALTQAVCPIGLINGSLDPVSGDHMVRRFEELAGTQHFVHRLARIGHYPHTEAPREVIEAYRSFLASVGAAA